MSSSRPPSWVSSPDSRLGRATSTLPDPQAAEEGSASFRIEAHLELVVGGYREILVSAPALAAAALPLSRKDLLSAGPVPSAGKFTIDEHLASLAAKGALTEGQPLLVLGLRNNLVNPRAIVSVDGCAVGAEGEDPSRSARPYYGLGLRQSRLVAESAFGPAGPSPNPFWAGVPVLWDDLSAVELFDLILVEAADHSHVFELPRGNHPHATGTTRQAWQALHDVFLENLYSDAERATRAMTGAIDRLPMRLQRAETYLHSVLGVDSRGSLVNVVAHGRLEDLGRAAARLGCHRAVCVENSGSVMPTFYPDGYRGRAIPLLRAPNFRPEGRMLLAITLESSAFDVLKPHFRGQPAYPR